MTVVRKCTQIVDVRFDEIGFARAPHDSVVERAREEFREYGDEIESHWNYRTANTRCVGDLRDYLAFTSSRPSGRITSMRRAKRSTRIQMSCARGIRISPSVVVPARDGSSATTSKGVPC